MKLNKYKYKPRYSKINFFLKSQCAGETFFRLPKLQKKYVNRTYNLEQQNQEVIPRTVYTLPDYAEHFPAFLTLR